MTDNQKAIYTELLAKKQQLDQLLQSNNITITTLTAEQQATLASLETIMQMEDAPQDIGKDQFVNDFEKYIVLYRSALMDYTEDNTPVDGSKFKSYLGEKLGKDSYNISEVLWTHAIKDIGDSTTTKAAIASKIRENLLFYTDNESKEIKALVKSRREKFPKLNKKKTLDGVLPTEEQFIAALEKDYAEDKNDPNHPDNIAARKKAEEERKAKEAASIAAMETKWSNWLSKITGNLNIIDDTTLSKALDIKVLGDSYSNYLTGPSYASDVWSDMILDVRNVLVHEEEPLILSDAITIAIKTLNSSYKKRITNDFLKKAIEAKDAALPSGLKMWLVKSIDKHSQAKKDFAKAIRDWTTAVAGSVEYCKFQLKIEGKSEFVISQAKLSNNLKKQTFASSPSTKLIGKKLIDILPSQPRIPFYSFHEVWISALGQIQTDIFIRELWELYMKPYLDKQSTEELQVAIISKLPTKEAIGNAMIASKDIVVRRKNEPIQRNALRGAFSTKRSNGQQGFHFFVHVPLTYESGKNYAGQNWHHAIPSKTSEEYYIEVPNSLSYIIDKKSLRITKEKTTYEITENIFTATTGVTFSLSVLDTLERRVVASGGPGKFNVLTLDSASIGKLRSKLGEHNINSDFLQAGIEVNLIGDKRGGVGTTEVKVNMFGFDIIAEYYPNKKWPNNIVMKSPGLLAYRKAKLLDTYGAQSYDIKFFAEIHSVRHADEEKQTVELINGRGGSVSEVFVGGETEIGHGLNVTFIKDKNEIELDMSKTK